MTGRLLQESVLLCGRWSYYHGYFFLLYLTSLAKTSYSNCGRACTVMHLRNKRGSNEFEGLHFM